MIISHTISYFYLVYIFQVTLMTFDLIVLR